MRHIQVTITGITPLIVNRFHEEAQLESSSGVHSRREQLPPEKDARNRLYILETPAGAPEAYYFPAENIRQSIINAASRHKIGRKSATSDIAAAVYLEPFAVPLQGGWTVDTRPVVIPATRGRVLRHRPIFNDWKLTFILQADEQLIDMKLLRRIVDDAGNYVGIGDFRPARKGPYGKYRVDSWELIADEEVPQTTGKVPAGVR